MTLSGEPAEYEAQGDPAQWHYYKVERAIEEAGFEWTHLRPGQFMNNTLDWAESIKADGVVRAPYRGGGADADRPRRHRGGRRASYCSTRATPGEKLTMSGPEAITQPEEVAAIGAAIGRELRFEELTPEQALERVDAADGGRVGRSGCWTGSG